MNVSTNNLYTDLAWLWPLWGDASTVYADYCRCVSACIRAQARRPVESLLNIGCGGGKNVFNLKKEFTVTGIDISPVMLAQAKELNPGCTFIPADMRDFNLGRTFDAVLMDDAISHMHTIDDFTAALRNAAAHLRAGGVLITTPDMTTETFQQNKTATTHIVRGPYDITIIENYFDSDPADHSCEATIRYHIREHGRLTTATDHWQLGLFPRATWLDVLQDAGLHVTEMAYRSGEDDFTVFACVKREGVVS